MPLTWSLKSKKGNQGPSLLKNLCSWVFNFLSPFLSTQREDCLLGRRLLCVHQYQQPPQLFRWWSGELGGYFRQVSPFSLSFYLFIDGSINPSLVFRDVRTLYLLGYIPRDDRVYLVDKDLNVVSYKLSLTVLEYQTAVLRGDFEAASSILPKVPADQKNKIARFLESHGTPPPFSSPCYQQNLSLCSSV